ncbi:PLC-like phosphodiesterase [Ampelomyces quisqualis]|uniref:PLC-like phosphodiesterase n=1 Tax=Ampelomyces quisqualis TaxID=50730 RepID=A0A6A5Q6I4_AMPQU|nr:PLC-like phosphodiesterase [Ampelomyces quisqualis]
MVSYPPPVLISLAFLTQCLSAQISSVASPQPSNLISSNLASLPGSFSATVASSLRNATATASSFAASSTTEDVTAIAGLPISTAQTKVNASITTSAHPRPSNTRPCNGYPEFCQRRFSNISMVVAHNSPFVKSHNAASNQMLPVLTQLNDGIRGLSFETQKPNSSSEIRLCHTSCDLLDVGTLESYLTTVTGWLDSHPYEVIALLMGNNNGHDERITPSEFATTFQKSGILKYMYTPPSTSMNITEWPTLGEMILRNKRVVSFLDYGTNQEEVPWLLSEWGYQWETPFSPVDPAFPCTEQRPPNQADDVSRNRMYVLNHNLNIQVDLGTVDDILIPAYSLLDQVNAASGNGSLGLNVENCEKMWGRSPNWLLVDYYNFGDFNGSVFQVAATANNVSYNRESCCGVQATSGASARFRNLPSALFSVAFLVFFG